MDVREQSPTRLVISASTGLITYVSGVVALGLGLLLTFGSANLEGSNIAYQLIVGPVGIVAGLAMLLGPLKTLLIIDKDTGKLSVKKSYLLGLVPISKDILLTEINQFIVQHQTPFKLKTPALKFIFKSPGHTVTFYSQNLHYRGKRSFMVQQARFDAHSSSEESLIPLISAYLSMPATPQERGIDSPNISKRHLYYQAYLVGGFILAIGLIWFYYHVLSTKR